MRSSKHSETTDLCGRSMTLPSSVHGETLSRQRSSAGLLGSARTLGSNGEMRQKKALLILIAILMLPAFPRLVLAGTA